MKAELGQFFTPASVASKLAAIVRPFSPLAIIDSNCGNGELLAACHDSAREAVLYGIDIDDHLIHRLGCERPNWKLLRGDALRPKTWSSFQDVEFCAAVLNPPFNFKARKRLRVKFDGSHIEASPALAHILATIENARPKVVVAILPESCASSGGDRDARLAIENGYDIQIIERLDPKTFPGATANAFIARMVRGTLRARSSEVANLPSVLQIGEVVRGGLPVHARVDDPKGLPFVHSVNLSTLHCFPKLQKVRAIGRGVVLGHFVLFPRVGLPSKKGLLPVTFLSPVQLSDCVMGIRCYSREHAERVSYRLIALHANFCELYKGTGARYITVDKAVRWFDLHCELFS